MSESSDVAIKLLPPTSGEVQNTPITIMEIGSPEFLLRRRCFETALVKSMPNSPLAIHKRHEDDQMSRSICSVAVVKKEVTPSASIATCCDENRLRVIPRLEKCLSENSLFTGVKPESTDSQSSASKSEGDVRNPDVKSEEEGEESNNNNNNNSEERTDVSGVVQVGGDVKMTGVKSMSAPAGHVTPDGLILPKRLHNPCLESADRKNLHRELMLNQKLGKNVLNQKSELQRAMEKHKENQFKKELQLQKQENMTPFEKVIEQRAKRLEILEKDVNEKDTATKEPEFLQIHAKLRARMESK